VSAEAFPGGQQKKTRLKIAPLTSLYFVSIMHKNPGGAQLSLPPSAADIHDF